MLKKILRAIRAALGKVLLAGAGLVAGLTGWTPPDDAYEDVPELAPESLTPETIVHQAALAMLGGGEIPDLACLSDRQREWIGELRGMDWAILAQLKPARIARHLDPKDDLDLVPGLHRLDGQSRRIGVIHPLPRETPRPVTMEVDDAVSECEPQPTARLA